MACTQFSKRLVTKNLPLYCVEIFSFKIISRLNFLLLVFINILSGAMCDFNSTHTFNGDDSSLSEIYNNSTTNTVERTTQTLSTGSMNSSVSSAAFISISNMESSVTTATFPSSSSSSSLISRLSTKISTTSSRSFFFTSSKEVSDETTSSSTMKSTLLVADTKYTSRAGNTQGKSFKETSPPVQNTPRQPNNFQKTTPYVGVTTDPYDILGTFPDFSNSVDETGQQTTATDTTTDTTPVPTTEFPKILPPGFCMKNISRAYKTGCVQCSNAPCAKGYITNTEKCDDILECNYECVIQEGAIQCCDGYRGVSCEECPGGQSNPCSGHGLCQDEDPFCTCDPGFSGTACEKCEVSRYGENCDQVCTCVNGQCSSGLLGDGSCSCYSGYRGAQCDEKLLKCEDLECFKNTSSHSRCIEVNGSATCVCDIGYRYDANITDCVAVNPCDNPVSPCGNNSICAMVSPGRHNCTCEEDYSGDGMVCLPINPCDSDVGLCGENALCSMRGPNKYQCLCGRGYENYKPGIGCSLINVCRSNSCPKNAICETYEPFIFQCTCKTGYVNRNNKCIGNIYQVLSELNDGGQYIKAFDLSLQMIQHFYYLPLQNDGPFTIFIPTDRAFRDAFGGFQAFLQDENRARQILRQHIIIGKHRIETLRTMDKIYTLQGTLADITRQRSGFRYKLEGFNQNAKVIENNIEASNGMIHLVNKILRPQPKILGDPKRSAMELIRQEAEYDKFEMLINVLNMSEEFNKNNITIFAPSNGAWNRLPNGALQFLMEDKAQGQQKLRTILRNHIYAGYVDVADLIKNPNLQSLQGVSLTVNTTRQGQILLNQNVPITQVDIPCKGNVYYYHIDGILIPSYLGDIVKSYCPEEAQLKVKGPCRVNCKGVCPQIIDTPSLTDEREKCSFNSFLPSSDVEMCHQICYRKILVPRCCKGFYGPSCLSCPGGFYNPCSGNGQCLDTISGTGVCMCRSGYTGTACQMCKQSKVFGPNCNQTCTCLHGSCDEGPNGSGKCKRGSCQDGYVGEDCENKLLPCGQGLMLCHAHSHCYLDDNNNYRCRCSLGFEGDGRICREINPCLHDNGGCHAQARCTKLGPGTSRCDCNPGWTGDGFYCSPKVACLTHSDCHVNATCRDLELDKHHCICNVGYKGNGTHCELVNLCVVNNGGCHPKALCTPLMFGVRNCSCPDPLAGDGFICFGTIADQVMGHPNLTALAKYLERNNLLVIHKNPYEKLTFFAPSDAAVNTYLSMLGTNEKSYLENPEKSLDFFGFHTLTDRYTVERLKSMAGIIRTYETLYDGFSLRIINDNQSLHIVANHSSFAMILEADIPAVNGYIHIIDKVLEPFIPDTHPLSLEEFLKSQPDLKLFYQAMKETGLLDEVMNNDQFTVFAPVNSAMQLMNRSHLSEHLKYYIVLKYVFTPTLDTGDTVESLLGFKHQLEFSVDQNVVSVNAVKMIKSDLLVQGGVLHIIEDLLHPVLHFCNNVSVLISYSSCETCDNVGACPAGFVPVVPTVKHRCAFNMSDSLGCQIACEKNETVLQCCEGFYGATCEECPGGSESPCNGHGLCSDGITGDGQCSCDIGYVGQDCGQCLQANKTPPFCTDAVADCSYMNGNCSMNAVCTITKSGPSCRCKQGFIGDGYRCSSPCETLLAGGCHRYALCLFNGTSQVVQCLCNKGYTGNGTWCTRSENPCLVNNGGCDTDRANCTFIIDTDTLGCSCLEGYVGNGTLCNMDIMDAVSRMPGLRYFNTWLITELLSNKTKESILNLQQLTLFAPINQNWETIDLLDLVVSGQYVRLSADKVSDNDTTTVSKNTSFLSAAGKLIDITVNDKGQFYVNGIPVVEKNVKASNGIIHLTAQPITEYVDVKVQASRFKDKSKSIIIIVTIAAVVIVALLIVAALVIYKKKYQGIIKIFKKTEVGSESNLSFARLSAQEEDSDSFRDSEASKYENPIYNDTDVM